MIPASKEIAPARRAAVDPAALVRLLRPKQWVKNVFVCAGVLFGGRVHELSSVRAMLAAVGAFCLMGSCVYVINDWMDRESDRRHPLKRSRPLASGAVTAAQAAIAALLCGSLALAAAWSAGPRVLGIILVYLTVNLAYSLRLKHQPVVDVFCIAVGFMLRIMAGTWGIQIPPSRWLLLTGMFVTLFLGFAKRRAEWAEAGAKGAGLHESRPVLSHYSEPLLDSFIAISATGTVLSFGLYTMDPATIALHHTDRLIYTLPFVLFGLFRYLLLLHSRNQGENPSVDLFTDPQILLCGLGFAGSTVWLSGG